MQPFRISQDIETQMSSLKRKCYVILTLHYKGRKKEILQLKCWLQKNTAWKETHINHPVVIPRAREWERNPVFITPVCPYGRAVSKCGSWWRTRVELGGDTVCVCVCVFMWGAVRAVCDWSAPAQRGLSLLHHYSFHSKNTSLVICVVFRCSVSRCAWVFCGAVENRVFPSKERVRGSASSHWQSVAVSN